MWVCFLKTILNITLGLGKEHLSLAMELFAEECKEEKYKDGCGEKTNPPLHLFKRMTVRE